MKESYGEGVASHAGPESCVGVREGDREALTGGGAGRVLSREMHEPLRGADAVEGSGRPWRARGRRAGWGRGRGGGWGGGVGLGEWGAGGGGAEGAPDAAGARSAAARRPAVAGPRAARPAPRPCSPA